MATTYRTLHAFSRHQQELMRRQRLPGASQPAAICIFCALRPVALSRTPLRSRRLLHGTQSTPGAAAAGVAVREDDDPQRTEPPPTHNGPNLGFGSFFDPGSSSPTPPPIIAPLPGRRQDATARQARFANGRRVAGRSLDTGANAEVGEDQQSQGPPRAERQSSTTQKDTTRFRGGNTAAPAKEKDQPRLRIRYHKTESAEEHAEKLAKERPRESKHGQGQRQRLKKKLDREHGDMNHELSAGWTQFRRKGKPEEVGSGSNAADRSNEEQNKSAAPSPTESRTTHLHDSKPRGFVSLASAATENRRVSQPPKSFSSVFTKDASLESGQHVEHKEKSTTLGGFFGDSAYQSPPSDDLPNLHDSKPREFVSLAPAATENTRASQAAKSFSDVFATNANLASKLHVEHEEKPTSLGGFFGGSADKSPPSNDLPNLQEFRRAARTREPPSQGSNRSFRKLEMPAAEPSSEKTQATSAPINLIRRLPSKSAPQNQYLSSLGAVEAPAEAQFTSKKQDNAFDHNPSASSAAAEPSRRSRPPYLPEEISDDASRHTPLVVKKLLQEEELSSRFEEDDGAYKQPKSKSKSKSAKGSRRRNEEDDYDVDHELSERIDRKRQRKAERQRLAQEAEEESGPKGPTVRLPDHISVAHLARMLGARLEEFAVKLADLGFEGITHDQVLNAENAGLIAMEYGYEPIVGTAEELDDLLPQPLPEDMTTLPQRPPVVTIMGHVDHGKTTILDYLRKSSVAASEHGGITQHIGAFVVPLSSGQTITFLDTPGHAAFLTMRQRGANVTDIVVLVVAADDSVMPQTIEAIRHARSANVPIIVAINKVDKEEANIERVKQDLARNGVEIEDFGGDTQVVCVSGKTGQGMQELEETIVTLSEILDHRAPFDGYAEGWVIEASSKERGRVATVLIKRGILHPGDIIVAGTAWARVRTLRNEAGVVISEAGPGTPVEVDGWRIPPAAGDEVLQAPDESRAAAVVQHRETVSGRKRLAEDVEAINASRKAETGRRAKDEAAAANKAKQQGFGDDVEPVEAEEEDPSGPTLVNLIVKADVSGSAEAVVHATSSLGNGEIAVRILRSGVGAVSPFDIEHAAAAGGHIITFNTTVDAQTQRLAHEKKVQIINQSIIYRIVEEVTDMLSDRLPPLVTKKVDGEAEIAQLFEIKLKAKQMLVIAGCKVRNGIITKGSRARVLRDKEIVYDGTLTSLKNVKKDVTEMRKNTECGMGFEGWEGFRVGDQVQCYTEVTEKRRL